MPVVYAHLTSTVFLLALVAQAHDKALVAKLASGSQDDAAGRVFNILVDRAMKFWPHHHANLDNTTLAKPSGHLAMQRSSSMSSGYISIAAMSTRPSLPVQRVAQSRSNLGSSRTILATAFPDIFSFVKGKPQDTPGTTKTTKKKKLTFVVRKPQNNPGNVYNPDMRAQPCGLPNDYNALYKAASDGVRKAIADGVPVVEIDFPPALPVLTKNGQQDEANAKAACALKKDLGGFLGPKVVVIGCSDGIMKVLQGSCGEAFNLREGAEAAANSNAIAIVVQPTGEAQWKAAAAIRCRGVVVLNGLFQEGTFPHAYFYKPMTGSSAVTGGVVRRYPGPYTGYRSDGKRVDLEIGLATQGARALPDTKQLQLELQR